MNARRTVFASALLYAVSQSACGAWLPCLFTIDNFYVFSNGDVYVKASTRPDWWRLCNVDGTLNGISSLTCATWASTVKTAAARPVMTGTQPQSITVTFNVVSGTCATIGGDASTPPVLYVMGMRS